MTKALRQSKRTSARTSLFEELLPDSFRALVADVTERMQVPMDYAVAVMVLCLTGAVNRRATIAAKAQDDSWKVVPNLWGGIIAPPAAAKIACSS